MSRLQTIENELIAINETVFQELCDSILKKSKNDFTSFSRTGSQTGKQKTVKGTPDTFATLSNGKFVFVEYSTNKTSGLAKLKEDLRKCLSPEKTRIPLEDIGEIILCMNFNLKPRELQELYQITLDEKIILKVHTLDSLALDLHLQHRNLAHDYLGVHLDTGQIVTIDTFIEEYSKASKGIATPLDNVFCHRESELINLKNRLEENDLVILYGAPGVGKTKLAIETMIRLNEEYQQFCVSYKNHHLLDDLYEYVDPKSNTLLFIDDANRVDALNQITGFYKSKRKGKLKIIMTVRDYALETVKSLITGHDFGVVKIDKLNDEQLTDIIKSDSFRILNPDYHKEILRIADGNPRLAIMTALLANKEQDIRALHDVSELFEKYFSTFIFDNNNLTKELNIKFLGIIAFFHTLPYKDKAVMNSILGAFELTYSDFIDSIDQLEKLELIEIRFDHVKIPEQNLSTFFFYKSFICDKHLSFTTLLDHFLEHHSNRFADCIIPCNNTFGHEKVLEALRPSLLEHLKKIENDSKKSFNFLSMFWFYLQDQVLSYAMEYILKLPDIENEEYKTTYDANEFAYDKNGFIELLSKFFQIQGSPMKDALELLFEYVHKEPKHLPEFIHSVRTNLIFDRVDLRCGFYRQKSLFEVLINGCRRNDLLFVTAFKSIAKTFLQLSFQQFHSGRKNSIVHYQYKLPNIQIIQDLRTEIWKTVGELFDEYPVFSFSIMKSYGARSLDENNEITEFDVPLIFELINKHLSPSNFAHCKFVHDLILWLKRRNIDHESFLRLKELFTNEDYKSFLVLDWDKHRDKDEFDFENFEEYDLIKENEIREFFTFNSLTDVTEFYEMFGRIRLSIDKHWNLYRLIDIIADEIFQSNEDLGFHFFALLIQDNARYRYVPRLPFRKYLNNNDTTDRMWNFISGNEFELKELWILAFFDFIDSSMVSESRMNDLIDFISSSKDSFTLHLSRLERMLVFRPDLFETLLKTITDKNENEDIRIKLWANAFHEYFDQFRDIDLIKKSYTQQNKINDRLDFSGKGLLKILEKSPDYLLEFVESLYKDESIYSLDGDHSAMSYVWKIDKIESTLEKIFDFVSERDLSLGIQDHFCNGFFKGNYAEHQERSDMFIRDYVNRNHNNYQKMRMVVDVVRHSKKELFDEILILFISLNQDIEIFDQLAWRGNSGVYLGDVIIGDIEASEWRAILETIENSNLGVKRIPYRVNIQSKIDSALRRSEWEKRRNFLRE